MNLYLRSITTTVFFLAIILLVVTETHLGIWDALLPVFEWMETSLMGTIGKTWGAAFAVVQAFHLLGLAATGGVVLFLSCRLLGLSFPDIDGPSMLAQCDRFFAASLTLTVATGVFMSCAVALKIYYLPVFWYKMLALASGVVFHFVVFRPLMIQAMSRGLNEGAGSRALNIAVGTASIMVWFTVAATGRWIGFSG